MNLLLIAKSNMKKRKSNVVTIFILIAISTTLFYSSLNVLLNASGFLDEKNNSLNGADIILQTDAPDVNGIESIIRNLNGYKQHEKHDLVFLPEVRYSSESDPDDVHSFGFIINRMEDTREISKLIINDQGRDLRSNSIVLPMYFKVGLGYETGDTILIRFAGETFKYEVYGFCEDVIFAAPSNITLFKCFVPDQAFNEFSKLTGVIKQSYFTIKLDEGISSSDSEDEFSTRLNADIKNYGMYNNILTSYDDMSEGTGMFINIIMAIVSVFAAILVIVAVVVIRFGIVTTIENNSSNIGIYKAEGYSSIQLKIATFLEFIIVTVAGILAGLLVSNATSGFIRSVVSGSMGLYWNPCIDVKSILITALIIMTVVSVVTLITSNKYKMVTPLDALRNGLYSHNFKKNHIPLNCSVLGVNSSLGFKNILNNRRQNITISFIVALLTFACLLMTTLYYNFVVDPEAMIKIVGLEKPDIRVVYTGADNDKMNEKFIDIADDADVVNSCRYRESGTLIDYNGKTAQIGLDIYDHTEDLKVNTVYKGRRPTADNEIAISNVIGKKIGADIGNVIYLEINGHRAGYLVTGITQQLGNGGLRCLITESAVQRVSDDFICNILFLHLDKSKDVDQCISELQNRYGTEDLSYINFDAYYNNVMSTFEGAIELLCIVFLIITVLVVTLVTILLVKIKLMRDAKLLGINKAMGYTSRQLIMQIVFSFAPVIIAGSLLGIIMSVYGITPAFTLMMSASGMESCKLNLVPMYFVIVVVIMSLLAVLVCYASSRKIRKIEPYRVIKEL